MRKYAKLTLYLYSLCNFSSLLLSTHQTELSFNRTAITETRIDLTFQTEHHQLTNKDKEAAKTKPTTNIACKWFASNCKRVQLTEHQTLLHTKSENLKTKNEAFACENTI